MTTASAIAALERQRLTLMRRLRATEAHIQQIRAELPLLDDLEVEARAAAEALTALDEKILAIDPNWQPSLPRGRPNRPRR